MLTLIHVADGFSYTDLSHVQENITPEQPVASVEEVNQPVAHNPTENGDISIDKEETPVPEVVDDIPDDLQAVAETDSKVDDTPKKSYAYIVSIYFLLPINIYVAILAIEPK